MLFAGSCDSNNSLSVPGRSNACNDLTDPGTGCRGDPATGTRVAVRVNLWPCASL